MTDECDTKYHRVTRSQTNNPARLAGHFSLEINKILGLNQHEKSTLEKHPVFSQDSRSSIASATAKSHFIVPSMCHHSAFQTPRLPPAYFGMAPPTAPKSETDCVVVWNALLDCLPSEQNLCASEGIVNHHLWLCWIFPSCFTPDHPSYLGNIPVDFASIARTCRAQILPPPTLGRKGCEHVA